MDNIKVAIRIRPLIENEILQNLSVQWNYKENLIFQIDPKTNKIINNTYQFDYIFHEKHKNDDVFSILAKPIIDSVVEGYNGTIFAYGQTSSGKTHTMNGNSEDEGLIPKTIKYLFNKVNSNDRTYLIRVSYLEIYKENIIDLLSKKKYLKVREHAGNVVVVDLQEEVADSPQKIFNLLALGNRNRQIAETALNDKSSRSHTIFRITIESRGVEEDFMESQLNLVDLAGSEKTDLNTGIRFKEGCAINTSLFMLSKVISQLSEQQESTNQFISYRDSKLTRILQNALGGNSLTTIICAVTPVAIDETHNTLGFASRAKKIQINPSINEIISDQALLKKFQQEIESLQIQLTEKDQRNSYLTERYNLLKTKLLGASTNINKSNLVPIVNRRMTWHRTTSSQTPPSRKLNTSHLVLSTLKEQIEPSDSPNLTDSFFSTPLEQFDSELRVLEEQHSAKKALSSSNILNIRANILQTPSRILKSHLNSETSENSELIQFLNFEKDQLQEKQNILEKLKRENNDMNVEIELLRKKFNIREDELLKSLEFYKIGYQKLITQYNNESINENNISDTSQENNLNEIEKNDLEQLIKNLNIENFKLKEQYKTLKEKLDISQNNPDTSMENIKINITDLENISKFSDMNKGNSENVELKNLEEEKKAFENKIQTLTEKHNEELKNYQEDKEKFDIMENQYKEALQQIEELTKLQNEQNRIDNNISDEFNSKIANLEEEKKSFENKIQELTEKHSEELKNYQEDKEKIDIMENQYKEALQQIEELTKLQNEQNRIDNNISDEFNSKIANLEEEKKSFENKIQELTEKHSEELKNYQEDKEKFDIMENQYKEALQQIEELTKLQNEQNRIDNNISEEFNSKIANLEEEKKSFENKIQELTEKHSEELKNYQEDKEKFDIMENQYKEALQQIEELTKLQNEQNRIDNNISEEFNSKIANLEEEKKSFENKIQELTEKHSEELKNYQEDKEKFDIMENQYKEALQQIEELTKLQNEQNRIDNNISDEFNSKIANLEEEKKSFENKIQELTEKHSEELKNYQEDKEKIDIMENQYKEALQQIEELTKLQNEQNRIDNNISDEFNSKIANLEEEKKSFENKIQELTEKHSEELKNYQEDKEKFDIMENQYKEALQQIEELTKLQNEQNRIDNNISDEFNSKIANLEEEKKSFENKIQELTEKHSEELKNYQEDKEKIDIMENQYKEALQQIEELTKLQNEQNRIDNNISDEFNSKIANLEEEKKSFENKIQELTEKHSEELKNYQEDKEKIDIMENQYKEALQQIEELTKLQNEQNRIDNNISEEFNSKIANLEEEKKSFENKIQELTEKHSEELKNYQEDKEKFDIMENQHKEIIEKIEIETKIQTHQNLIDNNIFEELTNLEKEKISSENNIQELSEMHFEEFKSCQEDKEKFIIMEKIFNDSFDRLDQFTLIPNNLNEMNIQIDKQSFIKEYNEFYDILNNLNDNEENLSILKSKFLHLQREMDVVLQRNIEFGEKFNKITLDKKNLQNYIDNLKINFNELIKEKKKNYNELESKFLNTVEELEEIKNQRDHTVIEYNDKSFDYKNEYILVENDLLKLSLELENVKLEKTAIEEKLNNITLEFQSNLNQLQIEKSQLENDLLHIQIKYDQIENDKKSNYHVDENTDYATCRNEFNLSQNQNQIDVELNLDILNKKELRDHFEEITKNYDFSIKKLENEKEIIENEYENVKQKLIDNEAKLKFYENKFQEIKINSQSNEIISHQDKNIIESNDIKQGFDVTNVSTYNSLPKNLENNLISEDLEIFNQSDLILNSTFNENKDSELKLIKLTKKYDNLLLENKEIGEKFTEYKKECKSLMYSLELEKDKLKDDLVQIIQYFDEMKLKINLLNELKNFKLDINQIDENNKLSINQFRLNLNDLNDKKANIVRDLDTINQLYMQFKEVEQNEIEYKEKYDNILIEKLNIEKDLDNIKRNYQQTELNYEENINMFKERIINLEKELENANDEFKKSVEKEENNHKLKYEELLHQHNIIQENIQLLQKNNEELKIELSSKEKNYSVSINNYIALKDNLEQEKNNLLIRLEDMNGKCEIINVNNKELSDFKEKVDDLEKENTLLTNKLDEFKKYSDELEENFKQKVYDLQRNLKVLQEEKYYLENELKELDSKHNDITSNQEQKMIDTLKEIEKLQGEITFLQNDLEKKEQFSIETVNHLKNFESQNVQLHDDLNKITLEKIELENKYINLNNENTKHLEQILKLEELNTELMEEKNNHSQGIQEKIVDLEITNNNLLRDIEEFQSSISKKNIIIEEYERKILNIEKENQILEDHLKNSKIKLEELNENKLDLFSNQEKIRELQNHLNEKETHISTLERKYSECLENYNKKIAEYESNLNCKNQELNHIKEEKNKLIIEYEEKLNKLEIDKNNYIHELQLSNQKLDSYEEEIKELDKNIKATQEKKLNLLNDINNLKKEKDQIINDYHIQKQEIEKQNQDILNKLNEMKNLYDKSIEEKNQSTFNFEKEIKLLKFENATLQNEFQISESNITKLNNQFDEKFLTLNKNIKYLEDENNALKSEIENLDENYKNSKEKFNDLIKNLTTEKINLENKIINQEKIESEFKILEEKQGKEISRLSKLLDDKDTQLSKIQNDLKEQKEKYNIYVEDLEKEKIKLKEENNILKNNIINEEDFKTLERNNVEKDNIISTLEKDINNYKITINDFDEKSNQWGKEKNQLLNEIQTLNLQIKNLEESQFLIFSNFEKKFNNIEIDKIDLEKSLSLLKSKERENLSKINEQENEILILNDKICKIEFTKNQLIKDLEKDILFKNQVIEEKISVINKLEMELKELTTNFEDLKNEKLCPEKNLKNEIKALNSKENMIEISIENDSNDLKQELEKIKCEKNHLFEKYEKSKKIIAHLAKKQKLKNSADKVHTSTMTDTNLSCTCLNSRNNGKDKMENKEIQINSSCKQDASILEKKDIETDYALLKNLYRELVLKYNNSLTNNDVDILSTYKENWRNLDEISQLKELIKFKEHLIHTNWLDHCRVLEIAYKENETLEKNLKCHQNELEALKNEFHDCERAKQNIETDYALLKNLYRELVLKYNNSLTNNDLNILSTYKENWRNLDEISQLKELIKFKENLIHTNWLDHCRVLEIAYKENETLEKNLKCQQSELETLKNEFHNFQQAHENCHIVKHKSEIDNFKEEKLLEVKKQLQNSLEQIHDLNKLINILNKDLIKKETNYALLKNHNKSLILQFAKDKRNSSDDQEEKLEIKEGDYNNVNDKSDITQLSNELNRLNKIILSKDLEFSMVWNQHLFMLEEIYLEKENLEKEISNKQKEIEKLIELNIANDDKEKNNKKVNVKSKLLINDINNTSVYNNDQPEEKSIQNQGEIQECNNCLELNSKLNILLNEREKMENECLYLKNKTESLEKKFKEFNKCENMSNETSQEFEILKCEKAQLFEKYQKSKKLIGKLVEKEKDLEKKIEELSKDNELLNDICTIRQKKIDSLLDQYQA